jgi:hypothetical protein
LYSSITCSFVIGPPVIKSITSSLFKSISTGIADNVIRAKFYPASTISAFLPHRFLLDLTIEVLHVRIIHVLPVSEIIVIILRHCFPPPQLQSSMGLQNGGLFLKPPYFERRDLADVDVRFGNISPLNIRAVPGRDESNILFVSTIIYRVYQYV